MSPRAKRAESRVTHYIALFISAATAISVLISVGEFKQSSKDQVENLQRQQTDLREELSLLKRDKGGFTPEDRTMLSGILNNLNVLLERRESNSDHPRP